MSEKRFYLRLNLQMFAISFLFLLSFLIAFLRSGMGRAKMLLFLPFILVLTMPAILRFIAYNLLRLGWIEVTNTKLKAKFIFNSWSINLEDILEIKEFYSYRKGKFLGIRTVNSASDIDHAFLGGFYMAGNYEQVIPLGLLTKDDKESILSYL